MRSRNPVNLWSQSNTLSRFMCHRLTKFQSINHTLLAYSSIIARVRRRAGRPRQQQKDPGQEGCPQANLCCRASRTPSWGSWIAKQDPTEREASHGRLTKSGSRRRLSISVRTELTVLCQESSGEFWLAGLEPGCRPILCEWLWRQVAEECLRWSPRAWSRHQRGIESGLHSQERKQRHRKSYWLN